MIIRGRIPGVKFTVFDDDANLLCGLQSGPVPFYEPGLDDLVASVRNKNLFFSPSFNKMVSDSQIIFVSVDTELKSTGIGAGQAADLSA
jgi:UDPglucose 6-dehydrogenase